MIKSGKNSYVLQAIVVLAVLVLSGCDSAPSKQVQFPQSDYLLEGVIVRDTNLGNIRSAIRVERNDTLFTNGILLFGSDSLKFNHTLGITDSIYSHQVAPTSTYPAGNFSLTLIDQNRFSDTLSVAVTGDFILSILDPPNHQWRPTDGVVGLDWSGSATADGYIMAAVKASKAYTGLGYSVYADQQVTADGLRPDTAFYVNAGVVVDTGLYYIYVYSYWGSPDKQLADQMLPTPIPTQLTNNIAEKNIIGRFGAITVSAFDSIYVTTQ